LRVTTLLLYTVFALLSTSFSANFLLIFCKACANIGDLVDFLLESHHLVSYLFKTICKTS
jgi:hypothetical protein